MVDQHHHLVTFGFFLFSLLFASYVAAVDPVLPTVVNTGTFATFVINQTQKNYTDEKINDTHLLAPFAFTSFSQSIPFKTTTSLAGNLLVGSPSGVIFQAVVGIEPNQQTTSLMTLGPCFGNGLTRMEEHVWTTLDFSSRNLTGIAVSGSISRVYQDASLAVNVPQYILFGPGINSYYAVVVPAMSENLALQIEISRVNSSALPPSQMFGSINIATGQQCLNPGSINTGKPGNIEEFVIIGTTNPALVSNVFSSALLAGPLYVALMVKQGVNYSGANKMYSITVSFPSRSNPPAPASDAGLAIGVILGILIFVGVVGVGYYIYKKRKGSEYNRIIV